LKYFFLLLTVVLSLNASGLLRAQEPDQLQAVSTEAGSPPHVVMNLIAKTTQDAGVALVSLSTTESLASLQLDIAGGRVSLGTVPLIMPLLMERGLSMFRKLGAVEGKKLASKLRAITTFNAGSYHAVVRVDSGIESWQDIKGKRVFVGPEAGGASIQPLRMIGLITGYKSGTDFEAVKLDWQSGVDGLRDGSIDMVLQPAAVPAAFIESLISANIGKLRILGVPADTAASKKFQRFASAPGTLPGLISAEHYESSQVEITNGGTTIAIAMAVLVDQRLDPELVYRITRSYIAAISGEPGNDLGVTRADMESMQVERGFVGLTPATRVKLHGGARRAWAEAGWTIPNHLD